MPFPTDRPSEVEHGVVPVRKARRKRRRRRKRPRTTTRAYREEDTTSNRPAAVPYQEADYADVYVRRRPVKRRRRPMQRRPLVEGSGAEEENVLPRRKLIRRPANWKNKTRAEEDVQQWEPMTTTEGEEKWKPVKTTSETASAVSTTAVRPQSATTTTTITTAVTPSPPKTGAIAATTIPARNSTGVDNGGNSVNHGEVGGPSKKPNPSRAADMVVLHRRPINGNLPPTSAVIRRRLKPQNTTTETTTTGRPPKIVVIKEELPSSLLPPGFKTPAADATLNESANNTADDYRFNDEALTKIMKEQPNGKNNEFKLKSDTIPKVKDEILSLLKTKTGSTLLSNVLNLRNMSLEELLQHRERGSSQRHRELIDTKDDPTTDAISDDPTTLTENAKNFTNYLIETKLLAQKNKGTRKAEELNDVQLFKDNTKESTSQRPITQPTSSNEERQVVEREKNEHSVQNVSTFVPQIKTNDVKSKISVQIAKEKPHEPESTSVSSISPIEIKHLNVENVEKEKIVEEMSNIEQDATFGEKKVFGFPTTTTYTTVNANHGENEQPTSFVSKTPKTRIILETSEREPRLFDSMPDFTIKTTPRRPLITPTIPSQVLFIQDTNHLDNYQSYGEKNKDIDEDNNLVYRRFEMRKLPVAVKSAIIASAAILAIAVLGFFVLLISCRMRQKKQILRKKSVFCQHSLHHDPDLRSSARSTSPVMDQPCHDQYYDGYGGHIDAHTTAANRQYYLWRTLRKTFRYD